ncbi:hypothetical protein [Vulcanisaeta distributa]|uniref:hypothetical protein n=1 Tax=Vulcanisaeta distributa TaxID=164451 RepID=UPI001FB1A953|nr:hypothetical protein [Vulcanisaeta distributa]
MINTIRDCQGNECVDSVNAEIDGLRADVQYLVSEIKRGGQLTFVVDFARAMYEIFQYLARFGLLNTEYKEFLKKVAIDGGEFLTDLNKMQVLFVNAGRILTHAACMARYRGVSRVGNYILDKALLLLGMAMDETLFGDGERATHLLASSFLVFYGKESEAKNVLFRAGYGYEQLDRFLNSCITFAILYELGIRFMEGTRRVTLF